MRIESDAAFQSTFGVSRETMDRLAIYRDLLLKWNARINLIARASEADIWHRHFADSAQLWALRPATARSWLDLGAGAGFPGLVIAALAVEQSPEFQVTLVESDTRKAVFLSSAAREAGLQVSVQNDRIETLQPQRVDVVSARALAPLVRLVGLMEKHAGPAGIGLFPKGEAVHNEVAAASAAWRFDHRLHRSLTDPRAAIVEIGAIAGARDPS